MHIVQTDKMSTKNDLIEFCIKYGAFIAWVSIGLAGLFGLDIINQKKITRWYAFGTVLCGFFVGYITASWCGVHCPDKSKLMVPIATLASRDIIVLIKAFDYKKILGILLKENFTKKK